MKKLLIVMSVILSIAIPTMAVLASELPTTVSGNNENAGKAKVKADVLNVRAGISTESEIIGTLMEGAYVTVIESFGDWVAIYDEETGKVGAVHGSYLVYDSEKTVPVVQPTEKPANTGEDVALGIDKEVKQILNMINKARDEAGLADLKLDTKLAGVAKLKADDMIANNYFSHNSPVYGSPFDMIKKFEINFTSAGENIAGNISNDKAFESWINSDAHRKNILNPSYSKIGIGISDSDVYGKLIVVQFVGE